MLRARGKVPPLPKPIRCWRRRGCLALSPSRRANLTPTLADLMTGKPGEACRARCGVHPTVHARGDPGNKVSSWHSSVPLPRISRVWRTSFRRRSLNTKRSSDDSSCYCRKRGGKMSLVTAEDRGVFGEAASPTLVQLGRCEPLEQCDLTW